MRTLIEAIWSMVVEDEQGASLVEYAFILVVVVVVSIAIVAQIGENPALAFDEANRGFER